MTPAWRQPVGVLPPRSARRHDDYRRGHGRRVRRGRLLAGNRRHAAGVRRHAAAAARRRGRAPARSPDGRCRRVLGAGSGSLVARFAPVLPFRRGASAAYDDGAGVFSANAITIVYVPSTALADNAPIGADRHVPGRSQFGTRDVRQAIAVCGFRPGAAAVVYDSTGAFDLFAVTSVDTAGSLGLQHMQRGGVGEAVCRPVRRSWRSSGTRTSSTRPDTQLMRYDGLSSRERRAGQRREPRLRVFRRARASRAFASRRRPVGHIRARATRSRRQPGLRGRQVRTARGKWSAASRCRAWLPSDRSARNSSS